MTENKYENAIEETITLIERLQRSNNEHNLSVLNRIVESLEWQLAQREAELYLVASSVSRLVTGTYMATSHAIIEALNPGQEEIDILARERLANK